MSILRKEWTRKACGEPGRIFSRSWVREEAPPKAVLVIAHGMAEHSARYDHFASFLAERGYAVYMNDHAGHGRSAQINGHFADRNGWENVVNDLNALMDEAQKEHPGLPLFLMGHSMGSFLSRSFLIRYGERLSGCILCGTMGQNPGVKPGKALAELQCKLRGPRSRGNFIDKLAFGAYNKRIKNPVNKCAWLSTDEENCKAYAADKMCGFAFTAAGYRDLVPGLLEVSSPQWASAVPKELPIYLVAGTDDPVGNYGVGPRQVADALREAGVKNVELTLYLGMRHELLNETEKQKVYDDILHWLETRKELAQK